MREMRKTCCCQIQILQSYHYESLAREINAALHYTQQRRLHIAGMSTRRPVPPHVLYFAWILERSQDPQRDRKDIKGILSLKSLISKLRVKTHQTQS